jgi:oxygen-independent coproporphyrinogen-3 oxidase
LECEELTRNQQVNEHILTGIRTKWGIDIQMMKDKFNFDLLDEKSEEIRQFKDGKHILIQNDTLLLTKEGMLLADEITQLLMTD